MPRARKASDDAYNTRRRAKRLIARMNRQGNLTKSDQAYMARLQELVNNSYARGRSGETAAEAASRAESAISTLGGVLPRGRQSTRASREQARRDAVLRREINMGSANLPTTRFGRAGRTMASIFFRATQRMWENAPGDRYEAILSWFRQYGETVGYTGDVNLEGVFDFVISNNSEALVQFWDDLRNRGGEEGGPVRSTQDPSFFNEPEELVPYDVNAIAMVEVMR